MKKQLLIAGLIMFMFTSARCQNTEEQKTDKKQPKIEFEKFEHDFGNIKYSALAAYKFKFTNTGKDPLVVKEVRKTCGCTTPVYSKEPVKKGKEGFVEVKYDTKRVGKFTKSITVYSNATNSPIVLRIKGVVAPKPVAAPVKKN